MKRERVSQIKKQKNDTIYTRQAEKTEQKRNELLLFKLSAIKSIHIVSIVSKY